MLHPSPLFRLTGGCLALGPGCGLVASAHAAPILDQNFDGLVPDSTHDPADDSNAANPLSDTVSADENGQTVTADGGVGRRAR